MKNYSKIRLISSCLFLGFHLISYEQSLDEELKSRLTGNENKKIEKADEIFQKGVKLEEEADNILNMASSSSNNDKISIRKKYTSKRLEVASYYYTSNHDKIEVYQTAIKNFWKKFSGDKNSLKEIHAIEGMTDDSISYATDLRSNANQSANNFAKLDLILQAETIEKRVSPMLAKVLFSYLSYPVQYDPAWISSQSTVIPGSPPNEIANNNSIPEQPVTVTQPEVVQTDTTSLKKDTSSYAITPPLRKLAAQDTVNPVFHKEQNKEILNKPSDYTFQPQQKQLQANDSSLYGKIAVSEEQVDEFNKFLKKKYPANYENLIINFQELDYMDVNALREAWYKYLYGYQPEDSIQLANKSDRGTIYPDTIHKNKFLSTIHEGETVAEVQKPNQTINKLLTANEKTVIRNVGENDTILKGPSETGEFIFRVQIAACRVPIDEKALEGIYGGSEPIIELQEDHWYKYAISQFTTYHMARQLRDQIKVPGAFVIAYLHGRRIKITPAIAYKQTHGHSGINRSGMGIVFRVQIIASKKELNDKILKNIYSGKLTIDKILEDGWYKYSINCGDNYKDAVNMVKNLAIPGAFIVAYDHNQKKVNFDQEDNR